MAVILEKEVVVTVVVMTEAIQATVDAVKVVATVNNYSLCPLLQGMQLQYHYREIEIQ